MENSFLCDSKVGGNLYREISKGFHWLVPRENMNYILQLTSYFSLILKSYIYSSGIIFTLLKESLGTYIFYNRMGWKLLLLVLLYLDTENYAEDT